MTMTRKLLFADPMTGSPERPTLLPEAHSRWSVAALQGSYPTGDHPAWRRSCLLATHQFW